MKLGDQFKKARQEIRTCNFDQALTCLEDDFKDAYKEKKYPRLPPNQSQAVAIQQVC